MPNKHYKNIITPEFKVLKHKINKKREHQTNIFLSQSSLRNLNKSQLLVLVLAPLLLS